MHIYVVGGVGIQIFDCVRMSAGWLWRASGNVHAGRYNHHFPVGFIAARHPVDVCCGSRDIAGRNVGGSVAKRSKVKDDIVHVSVVVARGRLRSLDGNVRTRSCVLGEWY